MKRLRNEMNSEQNGTDRKRAKRTERLKVFALSTVLVAGTFGLFVAKATIWQSSGPSQSQVMDEIRRQIYPTRSLKYLEALAEEAHDANASTNDAGIESNTSPERGSVVYQDSQVGFSFINGSPTEVGGYLITFTWNTVTGPNGETSITGSTSVAREDTPDQQIANFNGVNGGFSIRTLEDNMIITITSHGMRRGAIVADVNVEQIAQPMQ